MKGVCLGPADNPDQKRQHFRLEFPVKERPRLRIDQQDLEVLDVSEGGCSIQCDEAAFVRLRPGTPVSGVMTFAGGEKVDVSGKVLRVIAGRRLALSFSKGLPQPLMMSEHRRILQKYSK